MKPLSRILAQPAAQSSRRWRIAALVAVLTLAVETLHGQKPARPLGRANFRSDSTLVLVPMTVTDRHHRLVTGLPANAFRVFEDRSPKEEYKLSEEDTPASIGIVFDISGSMKGPLNYAKAALHTLVETANPQDEGFLYTVSDRPDSNSQFTNDLDGLATGVVFDEAKGNTALIDGVYAALNHMRSGKNKRRALIVISDGMDNHSRYTRHELMMQALETDAQIFCISVYDPPGYAKPFTLLEQRQGLDLLDDLSGATGGVHLVVSNSSDTGRSMDTVGRAIRNQYLISYVSAHSEPGKWHTIQVKSLLPGLTVHARSGYRAE